MTGGIIPATLCVLHMITLLLSPSPRLGKDEGPVQAHMASVEE